ncbi:MAG: hypothetical protein MUF01_04190 [Bryobacterales bacterium]|jgi:hypothetical protein|nr:hypothetical protein [Bryobacterales bacterium]
MNLPVDSPPLGWKTRVSGSRATVERIRTVGMDFPSPPVLIIAAIVIFSASTLFRILTSVDDALDVLFGFKTLLTLLVTLGILLMLLRARKGLEDVETLTLEPGKITKSTRRTGQNTVVELERSRVLRVIHSRPSNPDGSRTDGGSVELEYRSGGIETEDFYVMWGTSTSEVEWFVRLLEAWAGQRARIEDYVIDTDDDEDEGSQPQSDDTDANPH